MSIFPQFHDRRGQVRRVCPMMMMEDAGTEMNPTAFNSRNHDVNSIRAGSAHGAGDESSLRHRSGNSRRELNGNDRADEGRGKKAVALVSPATKMAHFAPSAA